jgi:hypothetical protein
MARLPDGGLKLKTRANYVFRWCLLVLCVISSVDASAVASGRPKKLPVLLSSSTVQSTANTFPRNNRRAMLESFEVNKPDNRHHKGDVRSRSIAKRLPWRRSSGRGLVLSGLAAMPAKRFVFGGVVAFYVASTIRKLKPSDPVHRSLYFWRHAGPIIVRSVKGHFCTLLYE